MIVKKDDIHMGRKVFSIEEILIEIKTNRIKAIKSKLKTDNKMFSKTLGKILLGRKVELLGIMSEDRIITLQDSFILDLELFFKGELKLDYSDSLVFSKLHKKTINKLSNKMRFFILDSLFSIFIVYPKNKKVSSEYIQELLN